jgi:hypothetical protein
MLPQDPEQDESEEVALKEVQQQEEQQRQFQGKSKSQRGRQHKCDNQSVTSDDSDDDEFCVVPFTQEE